MLFVDTTNNTPPARFPRTSVSPVAFWLTNPEIANTREARRSRAKTDSITRMKDKDLGADADLGLGGGTIATHLLALFDFDALFISFVP